MTSPYYQAQGGYSDALAGMYDSAGALQLKELEQRYKISKDEIGARLKIAGTESKDRRYGIDQQRDAEREKLAQVREEMERIGIPRMLIEKYVAEKTYEIALSEMSLKRDIFVEESAQAREKLKLDREEMERIGIPRVDIERYVAQQNAEIARGNFGLAQAETTGYYNGQSTLKREQFRSDDEYRRAQADEARRQFNVSQTGYMQQPGQLTAEQRGRYEQIRARDQQLQAAGQGGVSPEERAELAGYEDILSGRAGGSQGQATLDRERFQQDQLEQARRYGLDVSKFGAELASTPDTYFQARRFQGVDVPRLLGGAGAATTDVAGGPTPGVATMGAYLSGQDPYSQQAQAAPPAAGGTAPGAAPALPGAPAGPVAAGPAPLSPQEQARHDQLQARARQLAAAGEPVPPADAAELAGYQARLGPPRIEPGPGAGLGASPLSAQEQARWQQLMARHQQIRASGGPGLEGADLDEAERFQARGATYDGPTAAGGPMPTYGAPGPGMMLTGPIDQYGAPIAGGGGIPGMGGSGGGAFVPGPIDQYGNPLGGGGGGGGFANIDPVSGGSTLPHSYYGGGGGPMLNSYSPTASVYGGPAVSASVGPQGYSMPSWYTQQQRGSSPYPSQDPRQKQLAALAKALPPSPYDGLNDQDSAALKAMESIYKGGGQQIAGGEYERLASSGRLGFMQSAGRLLGYDPKQLESQYKSYRPAQGSSRMAG